MLLLRIALGLALAYVGVVILAWWLQERLAFPAPRDAVPDPKRVGVAHGERIELVTQDGTRLAGWYMAPVPVGAQHAAPLHPSPALLWFYGNGETIATIWPTLRDFQPPGTALLVVDYPGYGGSGGRATEAGLYAAADAAYADLARRPGIDASRIFVYGRSLGSAVATYTATHHPVAGVILESPFTNAVDMARDAYRILPRFIVRLSLDNLSRMPEIHCPVLVLHGTADRLVPTAMGMRVAAAAGGPVEVVLIQGSDHNSTYDLGGDEYRRKVAEFVASRGR
jgi:fermentation-respiration switch protein FrsA (DUF1100 family)